MSASLTPKQIVAALKKAALSSHESALIVQAALKDIERFDEEDMALCTSSLLTRLRAVPLTDTIQIDKGTGQMIVRGRPVKDAKTRKSITNAAAQMQKNIARLLVREKIEYAALVMAHAASTTRDVLFAKAAWWFMQEEDKLYASLLEVAEIAGPLEDGE